MVTSRMTEAARTFRSTSLVETLAATARSARKRATRSSSKSDSSPAQVIAKVTWCTISRSQSVQSVPDEHAENSAPIPPSSHRPSAAYSQSSEHSGAGVDGDGESDEVGGGAGGADADGDSGSDGTACGADGDVDGRAGGGSGGDAGDGDSGGGDAGGGSGSDAVMLSHDTYQPAFELEDKGAPHKPQ